MTVFPFGRSWFERHPLLVAYDLLGSTLGVERDGVATRGRVVEVEAYAGPYDLASHSGKYRAARASLFGEQGRLYIYRSYGIHTMLNIVAHEPGEAGGILFRALEPCAGVDAMRARRGDRATRLATGPGSLCQAMGVRLDDDGTDVIDSSWLRLDVADRIEAAMASPRIGVSKGLSVNWRLFDSTSALVSVHKRGIPIVRDDLEDMIPPRGTIIV